MNEPIAYSIPKAARMLGLSQKTLRTAIDAGSVPAQKIGARQMIPAWYIRQLRDGPRAA